MQKSSVVRMVSDCYVLAAWVETLKSQRCWLHTPPHMPLSLHTGWSAAHTDMNARVMLLRLRQLTPCMQAPYTVMHVVSHSHNIAGADQHNMRLDLPHQACVTHGVSRTDALGLITQHCPNHPALSKSILFDSISASDTSSNACTVCSTCSSVHTSRAGT